MSKFKVGDRVRFRGTDLAMTVRGIHDGWYWCEHDGAALGTYIGADLHPIPPEPAEVLAELERMIAKGAQVRRAVGLVGNGVKIERLARSRSQGSGLETIGYGDTLSEAVMMASREDALAGEP